MFFRIVGDMMHLASLLILIFRIRQSRNCLGISCKTQEMYLLVFLARYMDLFVYYVSLYNTFMKLAFIGLTGYLIFMMRFSRFYKSTYDWKGDNFPYWKYLLPPCAVLGLIFNPEFTPLEVLWSFSIFLEAVAFVPQLEMLRQMKEVENLTSHYVFCLGAYRVLYIFNWMSRYANSQSIPWISLFAGVVQSVLYADFFYYYIKARLNNQKTVHI